jgi:hypothetical protein
MSNHLAERDNGAIALKASIRRLANLAKEKKAELDKSKDDETKTKLAAERSQLAKEYNKAREEFYSKCKFCLFINRCESEDKALDNDDCTPIVTQPENKTVGDKIQPTQDYINNDQHTIEKPGNLEISQTQEEKVNSTVEIETNEQHEVEKIVPAVTVESSVNDDLSFFTTGNDDQPSQLPLQPGFITQKANSPESPSPQHPPTQSTPLILSASQSSDPNTLPPIGPLAPNQDLSHLTSSIASLLSVLSAHSSALQGHANAIRQQTVASLAATAAIVNLEEALYQHERYLTAQIAHLDGRIGAFSEQFVDANTSSMSRSEVYALLDSLKGLPNALLKLHANWGIDAALAIGNAIRKGMAASMESRNESPSSEHEMEHEREVAKKSFQTIAMVDRMSEALESMRSSDAGSIVDGPLPVIDEATEDEYHDDGDVPTNIEEQSDQSAVPASLEVVTEEKAIELDSSSNPLSPNKKKRMLDGLGNVGEKGDEDCDGGPAERIRKRRNTGTSQNPYNKGSKPSSKA